MDVVLLHGFAGTHRSWDAVRAALDAGEEGGARYRYVAPDLRGHGARAGVRPIDFPEVTKDVLAATDGRFLLAGYSLGGRVALHVALAAPERIAALVLVATTAGIDDAAGRAARLQADRALAERTRAGSIEAFAEAWMSLGLFAGTPPAASVAWEADIRRNRPGDLADVLVGLSPGVMTPLWDRLGALSMPAEVLVGARDAKYEEIGERLVAALPDARLTVVPGAGHGLPREAPEAVAAAIDRARARAAR